MTRLSRAAIQPCGASLAPDPPAFVVPFVVAVVVSGATVVPAAVAAVVAAAVAATAVGAAVVASNQLACAARLSLETPAFTSPKGVICLGSR